MKAYKDYMNRIKLDDEQHDRLMEAVKAAEAAEAAKKAETEAKAPEKVRRFPLKRLGWIASAAAVIVLIVAIAPKNRWSAAPAHDRVTEAVAGEDIALDISKQVNSNEMVAQIPVHAAEQDTVTADSAVPTTRREEQPVEDFDRFSVICGTAEYNMRKYYEGTLEPDNGWAFSAAETLDEDVSSALMQLWAMVGAMKDHTTVTPADDVSEIREEVRPAESPEPAGNPEEPETLNSVENTVVPESAELAEQESSEEGTEDAESSEDAVTSDEAIAFAIGEDRFDYDSEEGLLSADGKEYRLTEDEKKELNSLLDIIFTDR